MIVYYRRHTTWCKWPWNDEKDTDIVQFSTTKKNFDSNIILECAPSVEPKERQRLVAEALGKPIKKIQLMKTYNVQ